MGRNVVGILFATLALTVYEYVVMGRNVVGILFATLTLAINEYVLVRIRIGSGIGIYGSIGGISALTYLGNRDLVKTEATAIGGCGRCYLIGTLGEIIGNGYSFVHTAAALGDAVGVSNNVAVCVKDSEGRGVGATGGAYYHCYGCITLYGEYKCACKILCDLDALNEVCTFVNTPGNRAVDHEVAVCVACACGNYFLVSAERYVGCHELMLGRGGLAGSIGSIGILGSVGNLGIGVVAGVGILDATVNAIAVNEIVACCLQCLGVGVTALAGVSYATCLGAGGLLCYLVNVAVSVRELIGSINKEVEEALALIFKDLVIGISLYVNSEQTVRGNCITLLAVYLKSIARARGVKHKSNLAVCGSGKFNVCAGAYLNALGKSKAAIAYVALGGRGAAAESEEACGICGAVLGNVMSIATYGNGYAATGRAAVTASCVTAVTASCIAAVTRACVIVGICGRRSWYRIGGCVRINCSDGKCGKLCFLILGGAYVISACLNEVEACGKVACATCTGDDLLTELVAENGKICTRNSSHRDINRSVYVEYDVTVVGATAYGDAVGGNLLYVEYDIVISACYSGDIALIKALGVIENNGSGGVTVGGNYRTVSLLGSDDILLLCACVCKNNSLHLGDALLEDVIARGDVGKACVGVKVCILIGGGNLLGLACNRSCAVLTGTACEGVVVALNSARLYLNGILAL